MAITAQRHQTTASKGLSVLRLAGLIPSPYTKELNGIGSVRDTNISEIMKAIVQSLALADDGSGNIITGVHIHFMNGTTFVTSGIAPMIGYNADNGDNPLTAGITAILDYATNNSITLSNGAADIVWLDSLVAGMNRSEGSVSLSVQTSTGAVGTQVSANQDALVMVDLSSVTTASIAGNAALDLVLEVAPTNSATAGDWIVKGRLGNSQALSLAITLQSIQTVKGETIAYVPKGYYVKVRSTGATGTTSSAVAEARAILL